MPTKLKPTQDPQGLVEVLEWFAKQDGYTAAPSHDKAYAVELVKLGHLDAKASTEGAFFEYRITAQGLLLVNREAL